MKTMRVEYALLSSGTPFSVQFSSLSAEVLMREYEGEIPVMPPRYGLYLVRVKGLDGKLQCVRAVLTGSDGKLMWLRDGTHFFCPYVFLGGGSFGIVVEILESMNF